MNDALTITTFGGLSIRRGDEPVADLATASRDGTARLWDTGTGELIGEPFIGHPQGAAAVDFGPGGTTLAVGSHGGIIRLWDVATGQPIGDIPRCWHENVGSKLQPGWHDLGRGL